MGKSPDRADLRAFVSGIQNFFASVLENDFNFLWEDQPEVLNLARKTFNEDIRKSADDLHKRISHIPVDQLEFHGLIGGPMKFKLGVLASIDKEWNEISGWLLIF